jgi:UDP-N-acetylmuramyl pentapeptide phosphotransferase/UDP-N-acetylglucosamine-1-phosphate transferase
MIWLINLYNFMDGSDGLAGGMAFIGFSAYGVASFLQQDAQMVLMCGSIATASFSFLLFNFYPARIFMGDVGSVPLGFLVGALGVVGWLRELWPIWFPLLVFSPFIVDATVTLIKRVIRGEKFWQAHNSHYYQRLVRMGWGHRRTALVEYALMLATGASAVLLIRQDLLLTVGTLASWAIFYMIAMFVIEKKWALKSAPPNL